MNRILIAGAGAMGTIIGALLSKNLNNQTYRIDLLDTNLHHIAALNSQGAKITGYLEDTIPVNAISAEQLTSTYDLVISTVKQTVLKDSLKQLLPYLHDQSLVLTLQNGIPEDIAAGIVGEHRVIGGGMEFSGTYINAGTVELASPQDTLAFTIGEIDGNLSERIQQVQSILEASLSCKLTTKLREARFTKLIDNTVASAIPTALGCTLGDVFENDQAIACIAELGHECSMVLEGLDIKPIELFGFHPIPENISFDNTSKLTNDHSHSKSRVINYWRETYQPYHQQVASMLQDIRLGRPTEVDFINGKMLSEAEKLGIEMPMNRAVIKEIKNLELEKVALKDAWSQLDQLSEACSVFSK